MKTVITKNESFEKWCMITVTTDGRFVVEQEFSEEASGRVLYTLEAFAKDLGHEVEIIRTEK